MSPRNKKEKGAKKGKGVGLEEEGERIWEGDRWQEEEEVEEEEEKEGKKWGRVRTGGFPIKELRIKKKIPGTISNKASKFILEQWFTLFGNLSSMAFVRNEYLFLPPPPHFAINIAGVAAIYPFCLHSSNPSPHPTSDTQNSALNRKVFCCCCRSRCRPNTPPPNPK